MPHTASEYTRLVLICVKEDEMKQTKQMKQRTYSFASAYVRGG